MILQSYECRLLLFYAEGKFSNRPSTLCLQLCITRMTFKKSELKRTSIAVLLPSTAWRNRFHYIHSPSLTMWPFRRKCDKVCKEDTITVRLVSRQEKHTQQGSGRLPQVVRPGGSHSSPRQQPSSPQSSSSSAVVAPPGTVTSRSARSSGRWLLLTTVRLTLEAPLQEQMNLEIYLGNDRQK